LNPPTNNKLQLKRISSTKNSDKNEIENFKLNGEIFKKFLDHFEKRANGTLELQEANSPESLVNSGFLKTQEQFPTPANNTKRSNTI
jgi:hypothetical protein